MKYHNSWFKFKDNDQETIFITLYNQNLNKYKWKGILGTRGKEESVYDGTEKDIQEWSNSKEYTLYNPSKLLKKIYNVS